MTSNDESQVRTMCGSSPAGMRPTWKNGPSGYGAPRPSRWWPSGGEPIKTSFQLPANALADMALPRWCRWPP